MVKLHRIIESNSQITNTSQIPSMLVPPLGWVKLDLTGMDVGSSGLVSGINDRVYINLKDLEEFRSNNEDVHNYRTIVGHSYGSPFRNSLTYKPADRLRDSGINKRVAIPKPFVSKLKSYRYLAAVDSYFEGFGLLNWKVYSSSYMGNPSVEVPNSAYERRSTQQFAEYESEYLSLRDVPKSDYMTKREDFNLDDSELLHLVMVLFYSDIKWKSRLDKDLAKELKDEIELCIDRELFASMEDVVKEIPQEDLDMGIFSKIPKIKKYHYVFNIYTVSDYRDFILMMGGASPSIPTTLDNPKTDRRPGVKYYIIDSRPNAPHLVSSLTRDNGIVGFDGIFSDDKNLPITWDGNKIASIG